MNCRHVWSRMVFLGAVAMAPVLACVASEEGRPPAPETVDATVQPPIRSQAQLDAWLRDNAGVDTPLDRMGPGARTRFLASLAFGSKGLGGFSTADLGATLTPAEIRAVLALFGPEIEAYADGLTSTRLPGDRNRESSDPDGIDQRFTQLFLFDIESRKLEDAARGKALASRYHALFPRAAEREHLQAAGGADLKLLFRAASLAAFYAPDPTAAVAMSMTADEMEARGIASAAEIEDVRDNLLAAHHFDLARDFTARHPALEPLPEFVGTGRDFAGQPTLWRADDDRPVLERQPLDLGPLQVLVLAGCHFAADAARDIDAHPVLGPVFREHATWLSLPPGQEDPDAVLVWNREHPHARMEMLYDRADWPMFTRWRMPTFYVIRDGEVVGTMTGWSAGSAVELDALLRKTGLL